LRFKRQAKLEHGLTLIDVAPMVSIIVQLLVFFLLLSPFVFQNSIQVALPKTVTSDVIKEENLIILLNSENVLYLNSAVTTMKELEAALSAAGNKTRPVIIKADRRASLGRIIDIWDLCRKLGIEKINIATDRTQ